MSFLSALGGKAKLVRALASTALSTSSKEQNPPAPKVERVAETKVSEKRPEQPASPSVVEKNSEGVMFISKGRGSSVENSLRIPLDMKIVYFDNNGVMSWSKFGFTLEPDDVEWLEVLTKMFAYHLRTRYLELAF